jgi:hypothetical protein
LGGPTYAHITTHTPKKIDGHHISTHTSSSAPKKKTKAITKELSLLPTTKDDDAIQPE